MLLLKLSNKEKLMSEEKEIAAGLMYALSAFFGGWWLWDRKRLGDRHDKLEERLREVEQSSVGEMYVRRMIEDVVAPLKDTQNETRADVKHLLNIITSDKRFRDDA